MPVIKVFRCTHKFFQTSIGRLSSPGAVVPLAASSSVIGCHVSSGGGKVSGLGSGVFIAGKNELRKAPALSSFLMSSSQPTSRSGMQPHVSRGFI